MNFINVSKLDVPFCTQEGGLARGPCQLGKLFVRLDETDDFGAMAMLQEDASFTERLLHSVAPVLPQRHIYHGWILPCTRTEVQASLDVPLGLGEHLDLFYIFSPQGLT